MILANLQRYVSSKTITGSSINLLLSQVLISLTFIAIDTFLAHYHFDLFPTWKQLQLLINLVLPIFAFGIPEGYKYFSAKEPHRSHYHFEFTLLGLTAVTCFFLPIAYFLLAPATNYFFHHNDFRYCAIALMLLFFGLNMNRVLRYECINNKKTNRFLIASAASISALIGTLVLDHLILYNFPIAVRIAVITFSIGIFYLIPLLLLSSLKPTSLQLISSQGTWKNYLQIGLPLYFASFISIIVTNIDKAWLGHFYDKNTFALYAAAALEIPLFAMLSAAFSQSTFPEYVRLINQNLLDEAKQTWVRITTKVSYFTYPLLLLCMLFAKTIFTTVYSTAMLPGLPIFKTFLLIALWRNNYYGAILSAAGKSKWISFYSFLNLGLVGLGVFLVTHYGSIQQLPWVLFLSTSSLAVLQIVHEKMFTLFLRGFVIKPFTLLLLTMILLAYFYSPL